MAIGVAAGRGEHADRAVGLVVAHDAIVRDVGKQKVAPGREIRPAPRYSIHRPTAGARRKCDSRRSGREELIVEHLVIAGGHSDFLQCCGRLKIAALRRVSSRPRTPLLSRASEARPGEPFASLLSRVRRNRSRLARRFATLGRDDGWRTHSPHRFGAFDRICDILWQHVTSHRGPDAQTRCLRNRRPVAPCNFRSADHRCKRVKEVMVHDWGSRDAAFRRSTAKCSTRAPRVVNGAGRLRRRYRCKARGPSLSRRC